MSSRDQPHDSTVLMKTTVDCSSDSAFVVPHTKFRNDMLNLNLGFHCCVA